MLFLSSTEIVFGLKVEIDCKIDLHAFNIHEET